MTSRGFFHRGIFFGSSRADFLDRAGLLLLFLYLVAGVFYSAMLAPTARFSDEREYLALSQNLLHGIGFSMDGAHLTASRPPGYSFFLCALQALGGGFFSIRVAQFFLLSATVLLVCRLASEKKLFAGLLIATGLVICYPVLFYTSGTLYAQTLSEFLFVLAVALTLIAPRSLPLDVVTGFAFGALILVVPSFLLTLFVTLGTALALKLVRPREAVIVIFFAALLVGVWITRNAVYLHHFVPVASNSGVNFLVGNHENAVAYQGAVSDAMTPYYTIASNAGWDEFQSNSYYWKIALAYIREHPGNALVHYFERVLNFFNVINAYAPQNEVEISPWKQITMAGSYSLLLALLAWRLTEIKRYPLVPREKLLLVVYVLSAFTSAIILTRIRLRLPYDWLIIAVIALHLSRHLESWLGFNSKQNLSTAHDARYGR